MLLVPAPFEGPFEDLQTQFGQLLVPTPVFGLFENKPGGLNAMARIDQTTGCRVDELAIRSDRLQQSLLFRMDEILLNLLQRLLALLV